MITHGRAELERLALALTSRADGVVSGWNVESWPVDEDVRALAISAYEAVLVGDSTRAESLLAKFGVDIRTLLIASTAKADKITRADVVELVAAAMFLRDGFSADELFLPNVPKMSRKKSDSGIDVSAIRLGSAADGSDDVFWVGSVKHSVNKTSSSGVRWKVADSLSRRGLSAPYMAVQLRVLSARLKEQGMADAEAERVYLFLRGDANVRIIGVAAVADDLATDLDASVLSIAESEWPDAVFRKVGFARLRELADDCP